MLGERILELLNMFPLEVQIIILSAIPVTELRVSIPIAVALGIEPINAFLYAVIGNFIPIIPILLGFPYVLKILENYTYTRNLMKKILARTRAKSENLQKFGALGLLLFVAVPLPGTGVWSGSLASLLFGIPFKFAFPAITFGMIIAGLIMTIATFGFYKMIGFLGSHIIILFVSIVLIFYFIKRRKKNTP